LKITKPSAGEYPEWYAHEIEPLECVDLILCLREIADKTVQTIGPLSDDQLRYRYAPGKWTIKDILQHLVDTERVLTYRAMRYARKDETILSGFDENRYAECAGANTRQWNEMLSEYKATRESTILLFQSFTGEMLMLRGKAGKSEATVRALGYLILGHNVHHLEVIKQKYFAR
jgi:hypothetical protein